MSRFAILALGLGAFTLAFVTLVPGSADAGWRRKQGAQVYFKPRWYLFTPRRDWRRYPSGYPYAYFPYWRTHSYYR